MLITVIVLLDGIFVYLSDNLYTQGLSIDTLHLQTQQLIIENNSLKLELLHDEALTTIEQKARAQGFVQAQYINL